MSTVLRHPLLTISLGRTEFFCQPCNRYFKTQSSLEAHWLDSERHSWCQRCNRFFKSGDALESHFHNSHKHWICDDHDVDFYTEGELTEHYIKGEDHHYCETCDELFDSAAQIRNVRTCLVIYYALPDLLNNVQHTLTHLPKDIGCWGCEKKFRKYSTMVAHLESEECSVTQIKLDKLAASCSAYKDYVIPGKEDYLRKGDRKKWRAEANPNNDKCTRCDRYFSTTAGLISHVNSSFHHPLAYQCAACKTPFANLSGLLAHVENVPCAEGISCKPFPVYPFLTNFGFRAV